MLPRGRDRHRQGSHRRHRATTAPSPIFSKSADPDESYGNAIVLIILKDVLTTIIFSHYERVDAVTRC
jgi:hypothetical protein